MHRLLSVVALSLSVSCADTGEIYVPDGPPPPQEEVIGVAPYPGAVRIGGYWGWEGGRHVWHDGRWERGRAGYSWEPHRWERRGNRWALRSGRWRRR